MCSIHPPSYSPQWQAPRFVYLPQSAQLTPHPLLHAPWRPEIELTTRFIGGDGLVLVSKDELIVIANRASGKVTETVFSVRSDDNWNSAKVTDEYKFGKVYLTTGAIRKDQLYVLHSDLVSLMQAPQDQKAKLRTKATIQQVANIRQ